MSKLDGKVAIVTGGSAGIGLATAKQFAEEGAKVYILARRRAELDAAVAIVGHGAIGIQGDVSRADDVTRLYAAVRADGHRVDVIFANVGANEPARLGDITEELLDKLYASNVKGMVYVVQQALPLLNDGASVVLVSSMMSSSTTGIEGISVYAATKAAVRSFARSWALELKRRNIRVNALAPGGTVTPAMFAYVGDDEEARKQFVIEEGAKMPLGRFADPAEQASAALFLASSESSYITGHELVSDGGVTQL